MTDKKQPPTREDWLAAVEQYRAALELLEPPATNRAERRKAARSRRRRGKGWTR